MSRASASPPRARMMLVSRVQPVGSAACRSRSACASTAAVGGGVRLWGRAARQVLTHGVPGLELLGQGDLIGDQGGDPAAEAGLVLAFGAPGFVAAATARRRTPWEAAAGVARVMGDGCTVLAERRAVLQMCVVCPPKTGRDEVESQARPRQP
ncbi:hypothetical protein BXU09_17395 [Deinococcus sp. LM3]|nr:hypothetical protein BXU09_17395 [Deinococcus sp. LM3]